MKKIILVVLLVFISKSYSQTDYSSIYINDSIIKKGVSLYDSKKFDEAIVEYNKIRTTDPKYLQAQYEKALSLSALEKKEELRTFLDHLYQTRKMPEYPELYTLYGVYFSDNKEFDLSEKIFIEGQKYLSNSSHFLYNFAILYIRKGETQKSIELLEYIITINPNHASSHYLLGLIAFENGNITEGTLALMSYLIIDPSGRFAEKAVLQLNAKYGENYLTKGKMVFSKSGDNFEEIETILRNQLPLNKAYKIKSNIDDVIIRQTQAVAEYTLEHKIGEGFFETTYIPWIKDMIQKNQFEGFSYYMLLSMEDKLGKKLTDQKKKIFNFRDNYYSKEFWDFFAKRKTDLFGKQEEVIISLKNGDPYLIGKLIDGKSEGKYKYLDKNGKLIGELNFSNNELEGLQKYYNEDGNLIEEKTFKNGQLDGPKKTYYSNGAISLIENYKENTLDGISTSYYPNGGKQCEVNFINGERDGKFVCFFENGIQKMNIEYTNGKRNGSYKTQNELGDLIEILNYENDSINGDYFEYYNGKTIKYQTQYIKGEIQNNYKTFYVNSTLERENHFTNGKIISSNNYFPTGKKSSVAIYNNKQELENYRYFDSNENLYYEEIYKSGEIKNGLQYSINNPKPVEINLTKSNFQMKNFNETILVSGAFEKGKKTNKWLYNYTSGALKLEENFTDGVLNGLSTEFDKNGSVNSIRNYSNDKINGRYEVYEYGKLISFYNYIDDIKNGPYQTFYPDGALKSEGYFIDNDLNYNYNSYWQNGKISRKSKYIEGIETSTTTYNEKGEIDNDINYKNKTGTFTTNFYNNTITQVSEFVNGKLNGPFLEKDKLNTPIVEANYINGYLNNNYKYYSPLGTLYLGSNYYLGKKNGKTKVHDLVGNLRLEYNNILGVANGKTIQYYNNKAKLSEYTEINDSKEGDHLYYNQKGELVLTIGYQNNSPVYYIAKNKTGESTGKIDIKNENVSIISYYPNGKTAIQYNLVNGELDGKFAIYNDSGKTEYESNYRNNLLNGERIEFYPNGNIYKKEHFLNNNYDGIQEYFTADAKPWISSEYKNDELHGITLIYNAGKLILTKKYNSNELVDIIK